MLKSRLIEVRNPTKKEKKEHGAEVIFIRENRFTGTKYTIYGCVCYESYQQWGQTRDILGDNVDDIEKWRRGKDA